MSGPRHAMAAAIVLAGGRSSRMGRPKESLPWAGTSLLGRTVTVLGGVARSVIVVRAVGQRLPPLPPGVVVVEDARPDRGPLEGLLAGLRALDDPDDVAFVCATDMPRLNPRLAVRVVELLEPGRDAAVPQVDGRLQPLAGAYRARLADLAAARLDAGRLSMVGLLEACGARVLEPSTLLADAELAAADPALQSLTNLNTPAELAAALRTNG